MLVQSDWLNVMPLAFFFKHRGFPRPAPQNHEGGVGRDSSAPHTCQSERRLEGCSRRVGPDQKFNEVPRTEASDELSPAPQRQVHSAETYPNRRKTTVYTAR
jgi:hypothetical protein